MLEALMTIFFVCAFFVLCANPRRFMLNFHILIPKIHRLYLVSEFCSEASLCRVYITHHYALPAAYHKYTNLTSLISP